MFTYFFASIGVIPLFIGRAFTPIFATAVIARIGSEWAWIAESQGFVLLESIPAWASSDATLLILGSMAAIELVVTKIPEAREIMIHTDTQLKGIAAFLTCFFLVEGDPMMLVEHIKQEGVGLDMASGLSIEYVWSFVIGGIVWFGATMRRRIYGFLIEMDEDDSVGIQGFFSWVEDSIGFFGLFFAIVLPFFASLMAGAALVGLYLARRYFEASEAKKLIPCPACDANNHLCGVECGSCREPLPEPHRVGIFGTSRDQRVTDVEEHRFELRAQKRCPSCADRLKEKRVDQICERCHTRTFEKPDDLLSYLTRVRSKLPRTMAISLGLSSVPIVGLLPGIIYYRLSLISSLRAYIPAGSGMITRWGVRFVNFFLICLQPIPFFGAMMLPMMCFTNHSIYRSKLTKQLGDL